MRSRLKARWSVAKCARCRTTACPLARLGEAGSVCVCVCVCADSCAGSRLRGKRFGASHPFGFLKNAALLYKGTPLGYPFQTYYMGSTKGGPVMPGNSHDQRSCPARSPPGIRMASSQSLYFVQGCCIIQRQARGQPRLPIPAKPQVFSKATRRPFCSQQRGRSSSGHLNAWLGVMCFSNFSSCSIV